MREPDIIMEFFDRLRQEGVSLPEEVAWKVERRVRFEYAGDRVRIAKNPPDLHDPIRALLAEGVSQEDVAQRFGVSKATVCRAAWINCW